MSPILRPLVLVASLASAAPLLAAESSPYDDVWAAWGRQEWDGARALAERLAEERPADPMAHAVLGYVLDAFGEIDAADPHLEQAAEAEDAATLKLVALVHGTRYGSLVFSDRRPAELERAQAAYLRWAAIDPSSPYPLQGLAWLRRTGGATTEALGLLYAAVARDPMADEPHADLWAYLNTEVSYDELAGFYEGLAITAASDAARGRCTSYQGQLLRYKGDKLRADAAAAATNADRISRLNDAIEAYRRAQPLFARATASDPSLADVALAQEFDGRLGVVECYADQGDTTAMRRRLTETREALLERTEIGSETFVKTVDALSYVLFRVAGGEAGRFVDADKYVRDMDELREFWRWACLLVDDRAEWWNNLGFFGRESEQYDESYLAYSRCIELAPDSIRYVNDTGLIQLYHLRTDLPRAEKLFRRAVELGEEQYPAVKDDPAAEAVMRSAWGDAMLNLGLILTEFDRFDEADEALAMLVELEADRTDLRQALIALDVRRGNVSGLRRTVDDLLAAEAIDRATLFLLVSIRDSLRTSLEETENGEMAALLTEIETALREARPEGDEGVGNGR